jgi:hypothetical protein
VVDLGVAQAEYQPPKARAVAAVHRDLGAARAAGLQAPRVVDLPQQGAAKGMSVGSHAVRRLLGLARESGDDAEGMHLGPEAPPLQHRQAEQGHGGRSFWEGATPRRGQIAGWGILNEGRFRFEGGRSVSMNQDQPVRAWGA